MNLEEEYKKIKENFENIAFFTISDKFCELWINEKKAIEVTRSFDGKILKIEYLGERT
jgi:hypothetical protein